MHKNFYIFIFFAVLSINISAQNIRELADSLYNAENYFDAITEYKRLLFFENNEQNNYYANYLIGDCYKQGGYYDKAIEYFSKSLYAAKTDDEIFNSKIMLFKTNLLRRTTDNAAQILKELENDYRFVDSTKQIYYWKGWLSIFSDNFKSAIYYFNKSEDYKEIKKICENTEKQLYSLTKAKIFSYILPGMGQFYTGEYLSGVLSLGWVALSGYLTIDAFAADRVFDGFILGDLLLLRFYRGNIQNAEKFVIEKNNNTINKTLKYLQENYKGMKP
jgi:tetratricopeptide (TPR) repeat protein